MKTTLLFDFVNGEILEFPNEREQEIVQEKHEQYKDLFLVFGRDYFEGHNVWFIKDVRDELVTRLYLEEKVANYLMRK